jgi:biopolymer transport protein ExbD
MSISSRKAGAMVQCPTCGEQTLVPQEDIFESQGDQPGAVPAPGTDSMTVSPGSVREESAASARKGPPGPAREDKDDKPAGPDRDEAGGDDSSGDADDDVDEDDEQPALQLRRRARTEDEMDLTPMVDVTFQLLIFFMVTASFALQKSIEVPTPDPDKKGAAQQLQILEDLEGTSIRVQIDASNNILIDDEPLADPAKLNDALKDKMRKEQKTEVLITAHAASLHRTVIAVIDAANSVGMQKIRLVSRQGKSE